MVARGVDLGRRTAAAAIRMSGMYPVRVDFLFPLILSLIDRFLRSKVQKLGYRVVGGV